MSKVKIYHNPRCTKSRETLQLLNENGVESKVVLYLESNPTAKEIKGLLKKLGITAAELIRKGEKIYKEKYRGKEMSEDAWIEAMEMYPKLIERPIVVKGNKAVIGRPPERVLELL